MDGKTKITASIAILALCAAAFAGVAYAAYSGTYTDNGMDASDVNSFYLQVGSSADFEIEETDLLDIEFNSALVGANGTRTYVFNSDDATNEGKTLVLEFTVGSVTVSAGEESGYATVSVDKTGTVSNVGAAYFVTSLEYKLVDEDGEEVDATEAFAVDSTGVDFDVIIVATLNAEKVTDSNIDNLVIPAVTLKVTATSAAAPSNDATA